jgi:hypothetical protein
VQNALFSVIADKVGRFEGMDKYEGDPEQPLSLHRYIYGADDPVNMIDPTGRTAIQGIIVHQYIGADFVASSTATFIPPWDPTTVAQCRLSNSTINTILGVFGFRSRPDLIDRCTHEVWEIKQYNDVESAYSDLIYYISILEQAGDLYYPGAKASYTPPPNIPLPGNNTATSWVEAPGIILYRITSSNFRSTSPFAIPVIGDIGVSVVDIGVAFF